jgi:hypothetical protein
MLKRETLISRNENLLLSRRFGFPKEIILTPIQAESLIYPSPMATPWNVKGKWKACAL